MRNQQLQQSRQPIAVQLAGFEGPFDLLIHLVEREKMSIRDIQVSEITRHYLATLEELQTFDPDLGSEFIYMAAYLLELKSRSLLPRTSQQHLNGEYRDDPRQELINRLLEYKYFRNLAEILEGMTAENSRVYGRLPSLPTAEDPGLAPMSLDNLFSAYCRALTKGLKEVRRISPRGMSVSEQMGLIRSKLAGGFESSFSEVVQGLSLTGVVVTFLAMLELSRLGEISLRQGRLFSPILIKLVKGDEQWTEK